ncbi:MAG: GGDEF domain-containing protein, partial [Chloroflexi bacterium]|nr:GGDEF domain-containing protein [Chloroflexota bacterium]
TAGAAGSFEGLTTPLPGQLAYDTDPGGGQDARLRISFGVPGKAGAPAQGVIAASVPLDGLLTWANYGLDTTGQQLSMLRRGDPVAVVATHGSGTGDPHPVLEVTGDAGSQVTGIADVALPGVDGWQVAASAPLTVAAIPLPALLTLIALMVLLIGATWWMGRKIIEPAAELDAQRTRFQDLYHTAREAALLDSLTGLGNHRAFQEALARMVDQARRYGTHFSLVMLDIDEFKRVNDTRGHAVGDELLAQVGDLIRSTIRTADAGFRVGGDEFALLLAETGAPGAEVTARRILSRGLEDRGTGRYKGSSTRPTITATSTRGCGASSRPRSRRSSRRAP